MGYARTRGIGRACGRQAEGGLGAEAEPLDGRGNSGRVEGRGTAGRIVGGDTDGGGFGVQVLQGDGGDAVGGGRRGAPSLPSVAW